MEEELEKRKEEVGWRGTAAVRQDIKIERLEKEKVLMQNDFAAREEVLKSKAQTLEQKLDQLQGLVTNPGRKRHNREKDGFVYLFDEEADYWKRRLDEREKEWETKNRELITKMVEANCEHAWEVERRTREEVEKEKKTWSGKVMGVAWSPPAVQTAMAEAQTGTEEKRVEVLQEKMAEKKRKKGKGKERAKDRKPAGVASPVTQEDMEMKDRSASSDGYEDLSRYEEEGEVMVTPPPVAKTQTPKRQGAKPVSRQPPPTKIPPKGQPGKVRTKAIVVHGSCYGVTAGHVVAAQSRGQIPPLPVKITEKDNITLTQPSEQKNHHQRILECVKLSQQNKTAEGSIPSLQRRLAGAVDILVETENETREFLRQSRCDCLNCHLTPNANHMPK